MKIMKKISLARQFMLLSFIILVSGMLTIGFFLNQQIMNGVMNQTSSVTALYVDSFVSPHLQNLGQDLKLSQSQLFELDQLLKETPLGKQIVSFKIWSREGEILYSPNQKLIGRTYPHESDLQAAFNGEVVTELSKLNKAEHEFEKLFWDELIETYAPIREDKSGEIIAVSEFYQLPDNLMDEIQSAQTKSWGIVGIATFLMYLLLTGLVGRASNTIQKQQTELSEKVEQLSKLLSQNRQLNIRVTRAANRTTALNEQFLRRISADLHDGPIQEIAMALMRVETLEDFCASCKEMLSTDHSAADEFKTIQVALETSMKEIRAISAGLRIPDLEEMSIRKVVRRVIREHKRKTNQDVVLEIENGAEAVSNSVKISLYRILQEALANGYRHSEGASQSVGVWIEDNNVHLKIEDYGKGFDPQGIALNNRDHLGIIGMRERVELLGGEFSVNSSPGKGTKTLAILPIKEQTSD